MSTLPFSGKVAVVTGAGVGIGRAIAQRLAQQGAHVLLNDLDANLAHAAAAEIDATCRAAAGVKPAGACVGTGGDVGEVEVVRDLVAQAVQQWGRLDLAVANAGVTRWISFLDYEPADFYRVLQVNLGGSFFLAQAAARQMRAQGDGGRILFTSSVTAHQSIEFASAYAVTKAGLEMLARNLVRELAPLGVCVNAIAPGATVTPRNLADDPNYEAYWEKLTPLGRPAYPEDIARAALFLLGPDAGHVTGQTLVVDGGWTAISPMQPMDFVASEETPHE
jgi:3-oxoacyl-[acyl-carrier protein] reductase